MQNAPKRRIHSLTFDLLGGAGCFSPVFRNHCDTQLADTIKPEEAIDARKKTFLKANIVVVLYCKLEPL